MKLEDLKKENEYLRDKVIELEFELKDSKFRELSYLDILNNLDTSLAQLFKEEVENHRFGIGGVVDYRDCLVNLKNNLDEYKRIYRINF